MLPEEPLADLRKPPPDPAAARELAPNENPVPPRQLDVSQSPPNPKPCAPLRNAVSRDSITVTVATRPDWTLRRMGKASAFHATPRIDSVKKQLATRMLGLVTSLLPRRIMHVPRQFVLKSADLALERWSAAMVRLESCRPKVAMGKTFFCHSSIHQCR